MEDGGKIFDSSVGTDLEMPGSVGLLSSPATLRERSLIVALPGIGVELEEIVDRFTIREFCGIEEWGGGDDPNDSDAKESAAAAVVSLDNTCPSHLAGGQSSSLGVFDKRRSTANSNMA